MGSVLCGETVLEKYLRLEGLTTCGYNGWGFAGTPSRHNNWGKPQGYYSHADDDPHGRLPTRTCVDAKKGDYTLYVDTYADLGLEKWRITWRGSGKEYPCASFSSATGADLRWRGIDPNLSPKENGFWKR